MTDTKKAAITIDPWKLSIFERHLKSKGYAYTNAGPLSMGSDSLLLTVETKNLQALAQVVLAANTEAAKTGKPK